MKYILVINSGSATLKVKVFEAKSLKEDFSAALERVGLARSFLLFKSGSKEYRINFASGLKDHARALKEVIKVLPEPLYRQLGLVAHRVVHGGEEFSEPTILNQAIIKKIHQYDQLAALHNPTNLAVIESSLKQFPRLRQVAIFDTAYFKDLPEYVYLYGLPLKFHTSYGLRKYGFHGLAHECMFEQAIKHLGKPNPNVITCHLGSGASLTAVKAGRVFDTSMGLTPLSGLVMGTRSGDLDPYLPLYLLEKLKMSPAALNNFLNREAGLKGLFGSSDLREILSAAGFKLTNESLDKKISKNKRRLARLTLNIFIYNAQRYLASYAGLLGKVEAIVFSGGIGERSAFIRQQILSGVHFIAQPKILVVKANEELLMAKKVSHLF